MSEQLKREFSLSYQIDMLLQAENEIGLKGKRVLEVGGALPRKLVLEHIGAETWVGVEKQDFYSEIGISRNDESIISFNDYEKIGEYAVVNDYVENITSEFYGKFDVIVSFAAFEHIGRFPEALSMMYLALRDGGKLFSMFSPIWPCHYGHHLHQVIDKSGREFDMGNSPIPRFGHLLMTPPQLYRHLLSYTDEKAAADIVYNVYSSPMINRLFIEDYIDFFKLSPFSINELYGVYGYDVSEEELEELKKACPGRKIFNFIGIKAILSKSKKNVME